MTPTLADVRHLDEADPIARFRDQFVRHDDPVAYLDGNSLGRPPKATIERLRDVLDVEWGQRLIRSWEEHWVDLPGQVGDRLASAVLGAAPGQTVIADSTTINLYKVLHAACSLRPDRTEIVIDDTNFPTDRYVVESVAASRGLEIRWITPEPVTSVTGDLLATVIGPRTAVVVLSHVDYRSATILDLAGLTAQIQAAGAVTVWDLCHSVGAVPIDLDAAGADFAVGCTYKYLNAGPGAPAFLYVAARHIEAVQQPITGWWSAADRFSMADAYQASPTINKMLSGTPNILGITAVDEGISMIAEAGIGAIRDKGIALTQLAIELADSWLPGMELVSPRDSSLRGSHISLRCADGREITDALIARQVIPDFRHPDMIRLGLSPLTTSYQEVWTAMNALREITERKSG